MHITNLSLSTDRASKQEWLFYFRKLLETWKEHSTNFSKQKEWRRKESSVISDNWTFWKAVTQLIIKPLNHSPEGTSWDWLGRLGSIQILFPNCSTSSKNASAQPFRPIFSNEFDSTQKVIGEDVSTLQTMQGPNKYLKIPMQRTQRTVSLLSKLFKQQLTREIVALVWTLYVGKSFTSKKYKQVSATQEAYGVKGSVLEYLTLSRTTWTYLISTLLLK